MAVTNIFNGLAINIQDPPYSVIGDGSDEYTKIQAALDSGLDIVFPPPPVKYATSATLALTTSGQRLIGIGGHPLIHQTTASLQLFTIAPGIDDVRICGLKLKDSGTFNATFRGRAIVQVNPAATASDMTNLQIYDNIFSAQAICAVSGNYIVGAKIHHNWFEADGAGTFGEHCVYLSTACRENKVHHNSMLGHGNVDGDGVTSNTGTDNDNRNNSIMDNYIDGFRFGVNVANALNKIMPGWKIIGNTCINTAQAGISVFSAKLVDGVILGNRCMNSAGYGMKADFVLNTIITGNKFSQNTKSGMLLTGAEYNTITGNEFIDNDYLTAGSPLVKDTCGLGLDVNCKNNLIDSNIIINTDEVANPGASTMYQQHGIYEGGATNTGNIIGKANKLVNRVNNIRDSGVFRANNQVDWIMKGKKSHTFSATPAFDLSEYQEHTITLTGNVTSSTATAPLGQRRISIEIVQDATGGRTFTWWSGAKLVGGALALSTGANQRDRIVFDYDPSTGQYIEVSRSLNIAL